MNWTKESELDDDQKNSLMASFTAKVQELAKSQKDFTKVLRDAICLTFDPEYFARTQNGAYLEFKELSIRVHENMSSIYDYDPVRPVNGTIVFKGNTMELPEVIANTIYKQAKGEATRIRNKQELTRSTNKKNKKLAAMLAELPTQ